MKNYLSTFALLLAFVSVSFANTTTSPKSVSLLPDCGTITASFTSSHVTSGENESVTYSNTSVAYYRSEWYVDDSLM